MKSAEEIMRILESFDLTSSYRDAGNFAGCSHHTVAGRAAKGDAGILPVPGEPERRPRVTDPYLPKLEEWVDRSSGKVRADVAYKRLRRLGFAGSERSVRRTGLLSREIMEFRGTDAVEICGRRCRWQ